MDLINLIKNELERSGNKLSTTFIDSLAHDPKTKVTHHQMTPNTRVCVVTLPSGHEVVGYAQVLDSKNDVELIGQNVAYQNAVENLWQTCGNIAKAVM